MRDLHRTRNWCLGNVDNTGNIYERLNNICGEPSLWKRVAGWPERRKEGVLRSKKDNCMGWSILRVIFSVTWKQIIVRIGVTKRVVAFWIVGLSHVTVHICVGTKFLNCTSDRSLQRVHQLYRYRTLSYLKSLLVKFSRREMSHDTVRIPLPCYSLRAEGTLLQLLNNLLLPFFSVRRDRAERIQIGKTPCWINVWLCQRNKESRIDWNRRPRSSKA